MPADLPLILFYNRFFEDFPDFAALPCRDLAAFTTDRSRLAQADAVLIHVPTFRPSSRVPKFPGQLWVAWSMESRVNYPALADPRFMRHFDLTMTYERGADVWRGYVPRLPDFESALRRPLAETREPAPAVLFRSASFDRSGRTALSAELMRRMRVDSYGKVFANRAIEGVDRGRETKLATIARYKFTLAFENSIAPDYVTEKLFDPLMAGSVPVYLGAPNVADYAPGERAFINVGDFATPAALADYLNALDRDDEAYRSYLAWRERDLAPRFRRLAEISADDALCRLAQVVRERLAAQGPRPARGPTYPFAKSWTPRGVISLLRRGRAS